MENQETQLERLHAALDELERTPLRSFTDGGTTYVEAIRRKDLERALDLSQDSEPAARYVEVTPVPNTTPVSARLHGLRKSPL